MLDWIKSRTNYLSGMSAFQSARAQAVTPAVRDNLHRAVDFFTGLTVSHKLSVTTHQGTVFLNDLELIEQLRNLPGVRIVEVRQALIDRPAGTVLLNNPEHQHRSYFKFVKITADQKRNLKQFFTNQTEIRMSPSLITWFDSPFHRVQDYHFIDHNGSGDLIMLGLIAPGLIRKTLQIQAR